MTAHNGNPADSPKPAQCSEPGCYVWTPHTHYGPSVTLPAAVLPPAADPAVAQRDNLAAMIQRLSEYLDSVSLNSWKHGACWAAEDAIKTLLAQRDDLLAQVGCTDPDRREGHCCGADE